MNTTRPTTAASARARMTVILAGANSGTGHHLLAQLTAQYHVIALSGLADSGNGGSHAVWRSCDPFSRISMEEAMQGADYAVYLTHSVVSSARLTQASPEDMEVILADNFARAACRNGIKEIIYISGYMEAGLPRDQQSRHVRSRPEAERILGSYGIPVTTIYTVTQNKTSPVTESLSNSGNGPLSSHEPTAFAEAVQAALTAEKPAVPDSGNKLVPTPPPFRSQEKSLSGVRSVQRVQLPEGKDADWAARYYLEWLEKLLKWVICVDHGSCHVYQVRPRVIRRPILELILLSGQSSAARTAYRICGGLLTKTSPNDGRLEFLQIPGTRECIIAIHDYLPSLPWTLYKYTQAKVHLWVMAAFRRHLQRMAAVQL
ncbi:hypothetical protein C2I18_17255 [Paenibacillus sp. PK3_47]|uniref:NAD(P)H-binding protein n=1 Tax=Paenibacillus sp. PK3_47 TaxID=2072642 RepID=UPI00201E36D1|nr:NAD(P)H-binding protein [Paenibacillus sp. PK3_47]UQZ35119.1 hypothetical protein C2I18_17255 [Paenibacillus sp. PK3_47]